ncbi:MULTISPECIES: fructose-specific PTS transporter subunit EIIC [unclassified Ruminococcus]|uniref:PTS fructose transporter subunit IIABC n=1 Tax=unclassified Ruminococcus TaxID=2608920 RepID=UPI00210B66A8|nr:MULTISPECIES: fructose-specific PTS transporter subunit EIIC [unclassified Ruminococcus]MCQ4023389.1 PTS fructose transporter subunit IIC [Ruminococcus sp. zg-924]MCQ4115755.1 PTS fructose transporter subunit IIC [Ruminococcus sp. zg-921]
MRITDLLSSDAILLNASFSSKQQVIDKLVAIHKSVGNISDATKYKNGILAREAGGTTAIGDGIAIPHAKSEAVVKPGLAAATVPNGVDYESMDGKPSNIIFMIAAPLDGNLHLEVLSRLTVLLMDEQFRADLLAAKSASEFLSVIDKKESEKFGEEAKPAAPTKSGYRVLAVTACPTGIAHTYMAAEALEKAGEKMGIAVKAETNGSGGAKNVLTREEIANCDGIIIAADKTVETARFNGKPVLSVPVAQGIHKPEELIQKIVDGKVPVFHSDKTDDSADFGEKEGIGRQLYKHLMNGVSHMLPFVVAGGILIALAFLIDTIMGAPQDGNFGTNTPVAAWFKTIGGYAFNFMIPILGGYIAMSIADRPGLLVGFVGGFMATLGSTFAAPGGDIPSGFLGALVAGFVGGYVMLGIERLCDKLPKALEGIKPVLIYPILGLAFIGVFMCAINPIMGWLNSLLNSGLAALGSNPSTLIPLCAIVGGMMAVDMGGPFNKAAYVFGTAMLTQATEFPAGSTDANACYMIMAAVMIGGMVPPIAIALATTFFKKKFTAEERKNGPVNYIMGLSFITEGAIPYAAADPARVIPSCVVGSAIAGALSGLFGCTLMAPHGGVFVFAVVGNWPMYVLALAVGSVVGMLLLGLLKKNKS